MRRLYARCSDCGRRVMLPRWLSPAVAAETVAGANGAEWFCMDCSGETPQERIEWANDARDEA